MIRTLLAAMEARTGTRPIIYTDVTFYREIIRGSEFTAYPFWLRSTAALPGDLYPGQPFVYWQFSGTGRVPGISGNVDRNVFNGSADDWSLWLLRTGTVPGRYASAEGSGQLQGRG
jgi:lysozyme